MWDSLLYAVNMFYYHWLIDLANSQVDRDRWEIPAKIQGRRQSLDDASSLQGSKAEVSSHESHREIQNNRNKLI